MNQLLASSTTPENTEDDTSKFVEAFYPSFDKRYYVTPLDDNGSPKISKSDERERLAVNPLLHPSFNPITGLFKPHPETKAERERERLEELQRMQAQQRNQRSGWTTPIPPTAFDRPGNNKEMDIHSAYRKARAHAAAASAAQQLLEQQKQSKPHTPQQQQNEGSADDNSDLGGLGGATSRAAVVGKGLPFRKTQKPANGNETTKDNETGGNRTPTI